MRRHRIIAMLASSALFVTSFGTPMAVAQDDPRFPPGDWIGGMWFFHEVRDGSSGVQYVGSGGLDLSALADSSGSGLIIGAVTFAVLVRVFTEIGASSRLYEADWTVDVEGQALEVDGVVAAKGVESALLRSPGEYVDVAIEFEADGEGVFRVDQASCASVSGTFSTGVISPPGAIGGVAFIAPFYALPGAPVGVEQQIERISDAVRSLMERNSVAVAEWDVGAGIPLTEDLRQLLEHVESLNQLIADAGLCGDVTGDHAPGGTTHAWLADLSAFILQVVARNSEFFSASELIDIYARAVALGAFASSDTDAVNEIRDRYPTAFDDHLAAAKNANDIATIKNIHTAACMWGWSDLKRRSEP